MPESVNGQEAVSLEQLKTLNDSYADKFIPYASSSAIANANNWLTTGYAKTSTSTTNLPAECTGTSMWGVLLFVAENAEMGTGTQTFFPIDGDQKGQMFVRSLTRLLATEPIIGEWHKLATESYVKDYVGQSGGAKVASESSIGGLELLWEGTGYSADVANRLDYEYLLIEASKDGMYTSYYTGLIPSVSNAGIYQGYLNDNSAYVMVNGNSVSVSTDGHQMNRIYGIKSA